MRGINFPLMAVVTTKCLSSGGQNMLIQYVVRVYPHDIKTTKHVYSSSYYII